MRTIKKLVSRFSNMLDEWRDLDLEGEPFDKDAASFSLNMDRGRMEVRFVRVLPDGFGGLERVAPDEDEVMDVVEMLYSGVSCGVELEPAKGCYAAADRVGAMCEGVDL